MLCRHCKQGSVCRPRGLCWGCYTTLSIRAMYPPTSKFAYRGHGQYFAEGTEPDAPTDALPGTPEKVAILAQRALRGQRLWHPADATLETMPRRLDRAG